MHCLGCSWHQHKLFIFWDQLLLCISLPVTHRTMDDRRPHLTTFTIRWLQSLVSAVFHTGMWVRISHPQKCVLCLYSHQVRGMACCVQYVYPECSMWAKTAHEETGLIRLKGKSLLEVLMILTINNVIVKMIEVEGCTTC